MEFHDFIKTYRNGFFIQGYTQSANFVRADCVRLGFYVDMQSVAEPLINYLRQLEAQGQTHVNIDDEARPILREFFIRAKTGKNVEPSIAKAVTTVKPHEKEVVIKPVETVIEAPAATDQSVIATGSTKDEKIASLKKQAGSWAAAKDLGTLRQTMVFSTGNPDADVMLVGEAPGFDEERLIEPFVGKAGQKLDGILAAMGVERKSTYISNIVKFRPSIPNQMTNNRKPSQEEIDACLPFIQAEVEVVSPKVIIALGGTAAQALLSCKDSVAKMRGSFHQFAGIPLRVTYHPSYILHNEATSEKRKLWEDMLSVMELLEMPISEKQRGYFLPSS